MLFTPAIITNVGAIGVQPAPSGALVAYMGEDFDDSSQTTYVYTIPWSGSGYAVIATAARGGSSDLPTTTVNGGACSNVVSIGTGAQPTGLQISNAEITSGSSITVSCTYSAGQSRGMARALRLNTGNTTAHDTASQINGASQLIDCPAGGVIIAVASGTDNTTHTYSGITGVAATFSEIAISCGYQEFAVTQTGLTVSVTYGTADANKRFAVASWGNS